MERDRLEAFSDGVIAVAITLLALDLGVAGPGHGSLLSQLGDHWPSLFKNIAYVDRTLLFLNLVLLLFVVVIPFATSTMAKYLTSGNQDAHVAMAIYAIAFEGMALSFAAIFSWTLGEGRLLRPIPIEARGPAWIQFSIGGIVYVVAIAVAFISAPLALAIIGMVAVYYVFQRTPGPHPSQNH